MLTKAFYNQGGALPTANDVSQTNVNGNPDVTRKPSNLVVRAALKRKRLASSAGSTKSVTQKQT